MAGGLTYVGKLFELAKRREVMRKKASKVRKGMG
jgi:hypothetical protein